MNILGFLRDSAWDRMDAVQYYRTYLPLREVHRHNEDIDCKCVGKDALEGVTDDELGGRDIYTMCRMYHAEYQPFVDEIHRRGGKLVLDSDDDLTETYRLVSGRGEIFKQVLGAVDHVAVSTQPLADLFTPYTQRPPTVLQNCVEVEWMHKVAANSKRIVTDSLTLGFSGSPTHWGDWYLPSVPFARIGRDFSDVTLMLHGEVPRYLSYAVDRAPLYKLGGVPFSVYPVLLHQFDVVLCAVDIRDRFNDGKSALKALECMALGVVPICSRFGPYMELEALGAPVVIVEEESRDGWYEAMRKVIRFTDRREWLSEAGPDWVREHRDMTVSGYKQWETFYREVAD